MKKKNLLLGLALLGAVSAFAQTPKAVEATSVEDLAAYTGTDQYVFNQKDNWTYVRNNAGLYERYGVIEEVASISTQPEAIKAVNDAYIKLDYKPKTNTRIEAVFSAVAGGEWKALYGTRFQQNDIAVDYYGHGDWSEGFAFFTTNGKINLAGEVGDKGIIEPYFGQKIKTVQDATTGKLVIYTGENLDNESATIEDAPLSKDCLTDLYLFAVNKHLPVYDGYNENPETFGGNNDYCYNPYVSVYSLKIYEGENLLFDFVPKKEGDKYGLYDQNNDKFYGSENEGSFVPSPTLYDGKIVFNSTDKHVYQYNATADKFIDKGANIKKLEEAVEYGFGEYKNLKAWRTDEDGHWEKVYGYGEKIVWNAENATNTIDPYIGEGGWEELAYTLSVLPGVKYSVSFDYTSSVWETWNKELNEVDLDDDGKVILPFQIFDSPTENGNGHLGSAAEHNLGYVGLTSTGVDKKTYEVEFTATNTYAHLVIQFGVVADGIHDPDYSFHFDNFKVKVLSEYTTETVVDPDPNDGGNDQGDQGSETPTAVNAVSAGAAQAVKVYTLGGVYVGTFENAESVVVPSKGIYIVNDGVNVKKVRF